jgi:AraC family transcriptional regulator
MNPLLLYDFIPTITYYDYHERKDKFLLFEDCYTEWALFAIEDGVLYYEIGEHKGTAAFGDLLLCPPGVAFRRVVIEPVSFHFIRLDWFNELSSYANPVSTLPAGKITVHDTDRLTANYASLRNIPIVTRFKQSNRRNHYFRDIWYMFCQEEEPAEEGSVLIPKGKEDTLMKQAEKKIRHNAFESFELRSIARELSVSPAQLTKRFKAYYGLKPTEYLTQLRLEKARSLLLETYLTLDQIAQCCGYENGFYLSRIFSKQFSLPPTEYRKAYRM